MSSTSPRPIVLLHGCGGSVRSTFESTGWLDAITACGPSPFALHLPGHGSQRSSHDPARYADLACLVARELPPGPFDAVGFSLGAKIVLEIALRDPQRVGRIVLGGIGDNVFGPERIAEAAARALESGTTADTPAAVLTFLRTWEPHLNDALAVAAVLRRPPNPIFTRERLTQVTSPVLIVNGSDDPVTQLGNQLVSSLRDVRCVTVHGVDHFGLPKQVEFRRHALAFFGLEAQ